MSRNRRVVPRSVGITAAGYISTAIFAFFFTAIVGCAARQPVHTKVITVSGAPPGPYMIGPDDVLEVIVWKEPELSAQQLPVAADGTITEPLAGRIQAAGKTTQEVKDELTMKLKPFVDNPNVTVRVVDARSQVIFIQGAVNKSGAFRLQSGEYLSQAIAEAGGLTEFADASQIRIERRDHNQLKEITVDYRDVNDGKSSAADIRLMKGDTIFVK
jgi:polysaccharide biosynthesis/export protein